MSDERLRRAEQVARAGGSEERAAYLRELMRAGRLSASRLKIAAFCGCGPAAAAIEWQPEHDPGVCPCDACFVEHGADFRTWLRRLLATAHGSEVYLDVFRIGNRILGTPLEPNRLTRPPGGWQVRTRKNVMSFVLGDYAWISA